MNRRTFYKQVFAWVIAFKVAPLFAINQNIKNSNIKNNIKNIKNKSSANSTNPINNNNNDSNLEAAKKNIADKQKLHLNNEIIEDTRKGFGQISLEQTILSLTGGKIMPNISPLIDLTQTNSIISDGRRGQIIFQTTLPEVTQVAIIFDTNPNMMSGVYTLAKNTLPYLEIPIKMRETGNLYVLVQSQNQWYLQKKNLQVQLGGCS